MPWFCLGVWGFYCALKKSAVIPRFAERVLGCSSISRGRLVLERTDIVFYWELLDFPSVHLEDVRISLNADAVILPLYLMRIVQAL